MSQSTRRPRAKRRDRGPFVNLHLSWLGLVGSAYLLRLSIGVFSRGWDPVFISGVSLNYWLKGYLPGAALLVFAQVGIQYFGLRRIALTAYYELWLKLLYRVLRGRGPFSSPGLLSSFAGDVLAPVYNRDSVELIVESREPVPYDLSFWSRMQARPQKKPTVVHRRHLTERFYWPDWAFAELLLFRDLEVVCREDDEGRRIELTVDLTEQDLGIYNNAGKQFLVDRFLTDARRERLAAQSHRVEGFLDNSDAGESITIDTADAPFRWASAGVLPVVRYRDRWWYALHFRGVPPVGWNLTVGGSENAAEYSDLHTLTLREFCEEMVLLDRPPEVDPKQRLRQKVFSPSDRLFRELPEEYRARVLGDAFSARHRQIRSQHDDLKIEPVDGPALSGIATPYSVTVRDAALEDEARRIDDVIFSINPAEFGIEVIAPYVFEMEDDDYLLFGELWEAAACPLRQPILLLSQEFVASRYREYGEIGEALDMYPHLDCRRLPEIPPQHYRLFSRDIGLRRRRVRDLQDRSTLSEEAREELSLHLGWLDNYGDMFLEVREQQIAIDAERHPEVATLCPVTWKTLTRMQSDDITLPTGT